jgi:predicted MPP superfamily phosphohydrolase
LSTVTRAIFNVVSLVSAFGAFWVFHAWSTATFPWLGRHRRGLAIAFVVLWVVDRIADRIVVASHDHGAGLLHSALVLAIATLVLAAPLVGALHFGSRWLSRSRVRAAAPDPRHDEAREEIRDPSAATTTGGPTAVTRRQVVEGVGGIAFLGATGSLLGWGMVRGRHAFELEEVPLRVPGLPRVLDGYVIAQVSDIHTGSFVGERELDEGLELVRRARPDLIVVTGDIVDYDPAFAPMTARRLGDLPSRDGIAAIPGNHDYYAGAAQVMGALRAAGVDVLCNAGKTIRPADGGGFALLGVDDVSALRHGSAGPRLDQALAAVAPDRPRILLSHQPFTVDQWAGQVAVQLSGHTHGGQINPGFSPVGLIMKYVAGRYDVRGTALYVNRGFGTVGPPSRVGAPPEITRFVLVAA